MAIIASDSSPYAGISSVGGVLLMESSPSDTFSSGYPFFPTYLVQVPSTTQNSTLGDRRRQGPATEKDEN